MNNQLYYGDNLKILREYIKDESVDLIYLDPPFNSNRNYNVLFKDESGQDSEAQLTAFEDTWHWDMFAAQTYHELVTNASPEVSTMIGALHEFIGTNQMMAYLVMMTARLIELHRVLKSTGSLYLHCDPTASHYLRIILDMIFGGDNFVNEIIWRRYRVHNDVGQGSRHYGRVHDTIFFYSKQKKQYWEQVFTPLSQDYIQKTYRLVEPETERLFMTTPLTGPGGEAKGNPVYEWHGHTRAWRYNKERMQRLHNEGKLYYSKTGYARQKKYLDESKGVPVQDIWDDIPSLSGAHAERLGYPTQKPVALLERILQASSNKGDVVADFFCGSGTTPAVAKRLNRQYFACDISERAIEITQMRLELTEPKRQQELFVNEKVGYNNRLAG